MSSNLFEDGGGGGVGALVLGPEPNMFAATTNRDTAQAGQTVSRTSVGTWTLAGGRPSSGGLQFNESLREVAISHVDANGNDVSAIVGDGVTSTLTGRTFRLQIDTNNRVDFTINSIQVTGSSAGTMYVVFNTSVFTNEVGVVSINNNAMLIPRELEGGAPWLAEYDANADYAIIITGPDPDQPQVRRDGAWVDVVGSLLRGPQGNQGNQGNPGASDGVADSVDLSVSGNALNVRVGRTGTLADLTDTVPLPEYDTGPAQQPEVFKAELTDVTVNTAPQTFVEVLDIAAADIEFNTGFFTVEAQTAPAGTDKVVLPMFTGMRYYRIIANMAAVISAGTSTRSLLEGKVSITRGTTVMVQDVTAREYNRGLTGASADAVNVSAMSFSTILQVMGGDKIGFQLRNINNFAFSVDGDLSTFEVERLQGSGEKGDRGDDGTGNPLKGAWVANTSYDRGDIVTYDDTLWILYGADTHSSASAPPARPLQWTRLGRVQDRESANNYRAGDIVIGSDDRLYICITDGANIATNPVTTSANWFLFNPTRQGLAWNTTNAYIRGDVVFQTDKLYMCQAETSTGTDPTTSGQTDWVEVGGGNGSTSEAGTVRGDLIASITGFATSLVNRGASIGSITWAKNTSPAPAGVVIVDGSTLIIRPVSGHAVPDNVIGIMFVAKAGATPSAVAQVGLPTILEIGSTDLRLSATGVTSHADRVLLVGNRQHILIEPEIHTPSANADSRGHGFMLLGGGTSLPANLTVEAYWAVASGPKGDQGDMGAQPPVYFYWANGASARVTDDFPYTTDAASDQRLRFQFAQANPNERVHVTSGPASWWVAGSSVANLDTGGAPAANTDRVVFQPPAGTWKLKLYAGYSRAGTEMQAGIGLFEIEDSTDDTIIAEALEQASSLALFGFTARNITVVESDEIVTDGTRQFYWMAMTGTSDDEREANWSFYMRAEKVV